MSDNSSGIQAGGTNPVEGLKATMKLSRDMGMSQRRKGASPQPGPGGPPPPTAIKSKGPMSAIATDTSVACPSCDLEYQITPEVYGVVAECESCGAEFEIKAPRKVAPAPAPAAISPPHTPIPAAENPAAPHQPISQTQGGVQLSKSDLIYISCVVGVILVGVIIAVVIIVR